MVEDSDGLKVKITCVSNVYTRMMHFEKSGVKELGHKHYYDHAMLLASGSMKVSVYDPDKKEYHPEVDYKAPSMVFIRKGLIHQLEALEDNTVAFCVHALKDEDEQIIDPSMIPVPSSLIETIQKYYDNTQKDLLPPIVVEDELSYKRHVRVDNVFDKF